MGKNDKKGGSGGGGGKGKGGGAGAEKEGTGKAKGAQSINVRHILVSGVFLMRTESRLWICLC